MSNTPLTDQRVEEIELMDLTPEQEKAELIILAQNMERERNAWEAEFRAFHSQILDITNPRIHQNRLGITPHTQDSPAEPNS